jgi:hypothetical protein
MSKLTNTLRSKATSLALATGILATACDPSPKQEDRAVTSLTNSVSSSADNAVDFTTPEERREREFQSRQLDIRNARQNIFDRASAPELSEADIDEILNAVDNYFDDVYEYGDAQAQNDSLGILSRVAAIIINEHDFSTEQLLQFIERRNESNNLSGALALEALRKVASDQLPQNITSIIDNYISNVENEDPRIIAGIIAKTSLTEDVLFNLVELNKSNPMSPVLRAIANKDNLSEEMLLRFVQTIEYDSADNGEYSEYGPASIVIAGKEDLPLSVMRFLATCANEPTREVIANRNDLPADLVQLEAQ